MIALRLTRRWFTDTATEGVLALDGTVECYTLEDRVRLPGEPKVAGKTAIPAGTYPLDWRWSPRLQQHCIGLVDVPEFSGVLIHAGNRSADTAGCILVGVTRTNPTDDWIGHSRNAVVTLEGKIAQRLLSREHAQIVIEDAPEIDERTAWAPEPQA